MLFNQLDNEYNQIYLYSTNKDERVRKFGHEALVDYCNSVFKFILEIRNSVNII